MQTKNASGFFCVLRLFYAGISTLQGHLDWERGAVSSSYVRAGHGGEETGKLARCGFNLEEVYADYDRSPFGSKYPGELISVAKKAE